MSGAGAGAVLRFRIASGCVEWACHGFGRPTRSPVTIGGELGSERCVRKRTAVQSVPNLPLQERRELASPRDSILRLAID